MHLGVLFTHDHLNGTKIYLPSGSKFLVKRSEDTELFNMREVSGQIFQSVENSSGAM